MVTSQFTLRIDPELKEAAQKKADQLGLGLGTITKLFFKSFVSQPHVVIYLGDREFDEKLDAMIRSKHIKAALKKLGKSL